MVNNALLLVIDSNLLASVTKFAVAVVLVVAAVVDFCYAHFVFVAFDVSIYADLVTHAAFISVRGAVVDFRTTLVRFDFHVTRSAVKALSRL